MKPSEHAAWLAVPGWCTPDEGDALYEAAKELPADACVVEIGTWVGRSAIALALSGACVTTLDSDPDPKRSEVLADNLKRCGVRVEAIYRDARMAARDWTAPVALLYIDGWHDTENVRADYAAWAPHVTPGGAIWFHDAYGAGWPAVQVLIDELIGAGALTFEGYIGTIAKTRKAVR